MEGFPEYFDRVRPLRISIFFLLDENSWFNPKEKNHKTFAKEHTKPRPRPKKQDPQARVSWETHHSKNKDHKGCQNPHLNTNVFAIQSEISIYRTGRKNEQ
jgi:hypothetical protein